MLGFARVSECCQSCKREFYQKSTEKPRKHNVSGAFPYVEAWLILS